MAKLTKKCKRIREAVRKARKLIADKKNWCQHDDALNKVGVPVHPTSSSAVKWCALGALQKYSKEAGADMLLLAFCEDTETMGLTEINDSFPNGNKRVCKLFDRFLKHYRVFR